MMEILSQLLTGLLLFSMLMELFLGRFFSFGWDAYGRAFLLFSLLLFFLSPHWIFAAVFFSAVWAFSGFNLIKKAKGKYAFFWLSVELFFLGGLGGVLSIFFFSELGLDGGSDCVFSLVACFFIFLSPS